jgi:ribose transport system substrate-binding protein
MSRFDTAGIRIYQALLTALALGALVSVAACGPSGPTGSGRSKDTPGLLAADVDVNKIYAPGVPTLADMYRSTEEPPPPSGPPIAKGKSVIFVSCAQSSPGCAGPPNEMAIAAKLVGWNYKIIDGANNVNNGWATGIRQAIAAKPNAIVVHGISCADAKQPFIEAKAAKIPVLALAGSDCSDPLTPGGAGESLFHAVPFTKDVPNTGTFFEKVGELQAAYVIDATEGKAKIIRTDYTPTFGEHQRRGQDAMLAKCPDCKVIADVKWTGPDSNANGPLVQKFRTVLAQHPDANAVILNYDSTATSSGLSRAIKDTGRAGDLKVVASGGYASAVQLIRENGGLNADTANSDMWLAWAALDSLNRLFNGQPLVPEGIGFRLIDKEHNMMPPGKDYEPPLDFRSVYKKSWGAR